MNVIIGGCGRVGALLAGRLHSDGHDVAVIDQDAASFERLGAGFAGHMHRGKVFDKRTLEAAGVERADAYLAVTSGDNSNVISAMVAKDVYRVPRVLARIFDPRRADIYRRLGIQAISSVTWATNEALALVVHPELSEQVVFGDAEVRLVSLEVAPRLVGRTVDELTRPGEVLVTAIVRAGRSFIPVGGTVLHDGDMVYAAVANTALDSFRSMTNP